MSALSNSPALPKARVTCRVFLCALLGLALWLGICCVPPFPLMGLLGLSGRLLLVSAVVEVIERRRDSTAVRLYVVFGAAAVLVLVGLGQECMDLACQPLDMSNRLRILFHTTSAYEMGAVCLLSLMTPNRFVATRTRRTLVALFAMATEFMGRWYARGLTFEWPSTLGLYAVPSPVVTAAVDAFPIWFLSIGWLVFGGIPRLIGGAPSRTHE